MEGKASLSGKRREERWDLEITIVDNLCRLRGAGLTEAFKEDWEEAAVIEGMRWEEAGRVVGWRRRTSGPEL